MNPILVAALKLSFQGLYQICSALNSSLWTPKKLSESLEFRRSWRLHVKKTNTQPTIKLWIHGASVGELEDLAAFFTSKQALQKAGLTQEQIILTASSSSTLSRLLNLQKTESFAYCGPLPPDTKSESYDFLNLYKPDNLLLSHNDLWPNLFLNWRKQQNSKTFFWYKKPKKITKFRSKLFELLKPVIIDRNKIGNLRLERIKSRYQAAKDQPEHVLSSWTTESSKQKVLIGSCRIEDAIILCQISKQTLNMFDWYIIPHHTENEHEVAQIKRLVGSKPTVIAKQGILLEAYKDFDLAWVGGGFSSSGLHNVLESLIWGVPVICGPNTSPQPEALNYMNAKALKTFQSSKEMENFLSNPQEIKLLKEHAHALSDTLKNLPSSIDKLVQVLKT